MNWLSVLGDCLTALFFLGIAGSCIVVVLFLAELLRTVVRGDPGSSEPIAGA